MSSINVINGHCTVGGGCSSPMTQETCVGCDQRQMVYDSEAEESNVKERGADTVSRKLPEHHIYL